MGYPQLLKPLQMPNTDEARYLLIRLCLRKQDKWHRIDQLKYQQEIGDPASVTKAIKELCDDGHTNEEPEEVKREETEIIDLTLDDDEEDEQMSCIMSAPVVMPTTGQEPQDTGLSQTPSFDIVDTGQLALAEDETRMTIHELLECLNADELKKFAKQMKQKLTGTVRFLIIPVVRPSHLKYVFGCVASVFSNCFAGRFVHPEHAQLSCYFV